MHHEDSWSHSGLSIWLSLYPRQIIHAIVIHIGIGNLVPLLSNDSTTFLLLIHNLREVIADGDSPLDSGCVKELYFYTPEDFQVVDAFCTREGIKVESRIHYEIHNESDFLAYHELISNLEPMKGNILRLDVKVKGDLVEDFRYNMDLTQPYNVMSRFSERLPAVSINFHYR